MAGADGNDAPAKQMRTAELGCGVRQLVVERSPTVSHPPTEGLLFLSRGTTSHASLPLSRCEAKLDGRNDEQRNRRADGRCQAGMQTHANGKPHQRRKRKVDDGLTVHRTQRQDANRSSDPRARLPQFGPNGKPAGKAEHRDIVLRPTQSRSATVFFHILAWSRASVRAVSTRNERSQSRGRSGSGLARDRPTASNPFLKVWRRTLASDPELREPGGLAAAHRRKADTNSSDRGFRGPLAIRARRATARQARRSSGSYQIAAGRCRRCYYLIPCRHCTPPDDKPPQGPINQGPSARRYGTAAGNNR